MDNTLGRIGLGIATAAVGLGGLTTGLGSASAQTPGCAPGWQRIAGAETTHRSATICRRTQTGALEYLGLDTTTRSTVDLPVTKVVATSGHPGHNSYSAVDSSGNIYRVDDRIAIAVVGRDGSMTFYERQI